MGQPPNVQSRDSRQSECLAEELHCKEGTSRSILFASDALDEYDSLIELTRDDYGFYLTSIVEL
jgi:hypothetical protein